MTMIHSVDSQSLQREITKRVSAAGIVMDVLDWLILLKRSSAESKARSPGALAESTVWMLSLCEFAVLCIPICKQTQRTLVNTFRETKGDFWENQGTRIFLGKEWADIGHTVDGTRSADFEIAIMEGSTIKRVGSSIFNTVNVVK